MYIEVNSIAPGNLVVGIGAGDDFYGLIHYGNGGGTGPFGIAINGTVEDVVVNLSNNKKTAGSGTGAPAETAQIRRLVPDARGFLAGGSNVARLTGSFPTVYGSDSVTEGRCLTSSCPITDRWEVRVVLGRDFVGVWAWAEGRQQFYAEYAGIDLRDRDLTLQAFNMNMGTAPLALQPPQISGMDMRIKYESTFSRVASRIYTASNIRVTPELFTNVPGNGYSVPAPETGVPCPSLDFISSAAVEEGFTPLLTWDLTAMGIQLSNDASYTISVNLFPKNLTSINNTVYFSLYDGQRALGVVTQPPSGGIWANIVGSYVTPLNGRASQNFPTGSQPASPVSNNPSPAVLQLNPYSARRIQMDLSAKILKGSNQTIHYLSLTAFDPEAPLAQIGATRKRMAFRGPSSVAFPLTPFVSGDQRESFNIQSIESPLSLVMWQQNTPENPFQSSGMTGASIVIDTANIGCDGLDYGDRVAPSFDICGVCGGDNSTCVCPPPCCKDYNNVTNACWNLILTQAIIGDLKLQFQQLKRTLQQQCNNLDSATKGAVECCSESAWSNSTAVIGNRACESLTFGATCITPFQNVVRNYIEQLQGALPAPTKK